MMQENVNDSPGSHVGPQPEGYMEGQMCVFVIRKVELERGHTAERLMKESVSEVLCAQLSLHRSQ